MGRVASFTLSQVINCSELKVIIHPFDPDSPRTVTVVMPSHEALAFDLDCFQQICKLSTSYRTNNTKLIDFLDKYGIQYTVT